MDCRDSVPAASRSYQQQNQHLSPVVTQQNSQVLLGRRLLMNKYQIMTPQPGPQVQCNVTSVTSLSCGHACSDAA